MFRGDLKPIYYIPIREDLGSIANVRLSEGQQEHYTSVLSMGCIKWNMDDVAS